jgi:hypothetical protein
MKSEEIRQIVSNNNIEIPAWILYTLVQYTEVSVKRGGISAGELTSVGTAWEAGSSYLAELMKKYAVEQQHLPPPVPETQQQQQQPSPAPNLETPVSKKKTPSKRKSKKKTEI